MSDYNKYCKKVLYLCILTRFFRVRVSILPAQSTVHYMSTHALILVSWQEFQFPRCLSSYSILSNFRNVTNDCQSEMKMKE